MTAPALSRPASAPRQERRPPPLTAVPPTPLRAPRAPFVVLVLALLGGGLVSLLLLNTALAQGAFTLHDLQRQAVALTEQQQALGRQLAVEQQPAALSAKARALGMVDGGVPAFLHLPDGKVAGHPHPAVSPKPTPTLLAPANPATSSAAASAKPTAKPTAKPSEKPTAKPTTKPSAKPTTKPTAKLTATRKP